MFLRNDHGLEFAGGTSAAHLGARTFGRAPLAPASLLDRARAQAAAIDWVPDLGANVGSRDWWRGLLSCTALCAAALSFAPSLEPLPGHVDAPLAGSEWDEARAQGIAPLGLGADTGRRMAGNDLVRALAEAPERPSIELSAMLGDGDAFEHVLQRAGVSRADAGAAATLLGGAVPLDDIQPGTRIQLTLGRRGSRMVARPLDRVALRARFDLNVTIARAGGSLAMTRQPIDIHRTLRSVDLTLTFRPHNRPARRRGETATF